MKSISYYVKHLISKRWVKFALVAALLISPALVLSGCGNSAAQKNTVKVGIVGDNDSRIWNPIAKRLKKQGIHVKLTKFTDYTQPNAALQSHEDDINAFQTIQFLGAYNKAHHSHIVADGKTIVAPLGIYSKKLSKLSQLKKGGSIAIPNDTSNEARALILLKNAGLIKLKKAAFPTKKDITSNPKNLNIEPVDAAQTPRALKDDSAAVINSGIAFDAGLKVKDALYHEKINSKIKPYVNIIATTKGEKNRKAVKKVVKAYQSKANAKLIKKDFQGSYVPAWNLNL